MFATGLICTLSLFMLSTEEPSAAFLDDYNVCGPVCLYAVARLKDRDVDFERVKELAGPPEAGVHSLADVADAGRELGLFPVAVTADRTELNRLPLPAIVHLRHSLFTRGQEQPHFVVLLATGERSAAILDPPFRVTAVRWDRFEEAWTGNLLLFADTAEEAQQWRTGLESAIEYELKPWLLGSSAFLLIALLVTIQWRRSRAFVGKLIGAGTRVAGWAANLASSPTAAGPEEASPRRWARRTALCLLLILVVAVTPIVVGSWIVGAGKSAVLETPGDVFDLGELAGPGSAKAAIPIGNSGTRPLIIERVASSCGCAVAEIPPAIEPGGKGDLELSLGVSPGPRSADLVLYSNDPQGPHRLVLRWHGAAKPMLLPPRIVAADVPVGSTYARTVHVVYPGGESAIVPEVVKSECAAPEVRVRVGKNDPCAFRAARSSLSRMSTVGYLDLDLRVESPGEAKVIDTSCRITLRYGNNEYVLTLPLRISFIGEVRVEPQRILFSENHANALVGAERRVKLRMGPGAATGAVQVKGLPDWLACDLLRVSSTEYDLCARVRSVPDSLCANGRILLESEAHGLSETSVDVLTFALRE